MEPSPKKLRVEREIQKSGGPDVSCTAVERERGSIVVEQLPIGPDGALTLDVYHLSHPSGASCRVTPYGCHVLGWAPAGVGEQLYTTSKFPSEFSLGQPIRGGIPVCWPQFATTGPLPNHGFLRTSRLWRIAQTSGDYRTPS